jgi:hypothetical protein
MSQFIEQLLARVAVRKRGQTFFYQFDRIRRGRGLTARRLLSARLWLIRISMVAHINSSGWSNSGHPNTEHNSTVAVARATSHRTDPFN